MNAWLILGAFFCTITAIVYLYNLESFHLNRIFSRCQPRPIHHSRPLPLWLYHNYHSRAPLVSEEPSAHIWRRQKPSVRELGPLTLVPTLFWSTWVLYQMSSWPRVMTGRSQSLTWTQDSDRSSHCPDPENYRRAAATGDWWQPGWRY